MRRKYEENGISTYDSGTPEFTARYGVKWTDEYDGLKLRGDFFALTRTETDEHNMDADNPLHLSFRRSYDLQLDRRRFLWTSGRLFS